MNVKRMMSVAVAMIGLSAGPAFAAPVVLDFEGVGNLAAVLDFYNGGTDGNGNSGTNYGVQFGGGALGVIDADAGGSGNIANEPSPSTVLFFLQGSAILNVAAGFDTGFSFFYSAANNPGFVNVWSGLNASGALLGTINLPANGSSCGGDPNGSFNCWTPVGLPFAGTAMSIDFAGTANQIAFDDVTFGSDVPGGGNVPEPASLLLIGAGIGAGFLRRRQRQA